MITIEKVDFIGIPVVENATGDAWFGETLGLWERNPRSNERWVEFEAPNVTLALVPEAYKPGDHVPLPFGAFAIRVDDVDEEKERLSAADVEFVGETFDSGVCKGAMFTGLDGNGMLLHHRYAPFADGRTPDAPRGRIDFVAIPVQERAAGRGLLRPHARARAEPELDRDLGRVRDVERHAGARAAGADRAALRAAPGRDGRVPRPRRRGGEGRSSSRWASSSPPG